VERGVQLLQMLPQGMHKAVQGLLEAVSPATDPTNAPIIGVAPPWLVSCWETGGRRGWWEAAPMSHEPNARLAPPRAVLASAASLDLSTAASIFKAVMWWNLPSESIPQHFHGHATAVGGQTADRQVSPKIIMLTPKALLWPESLAALWGLYRQFLNIAAISGVSPFYSCKGNLPPVPLMLC
jgi:hypothetical protein